VKNEGKLAVTCRLRAKKERRRELTGRYSFKEGGKGGEVPIFAFPVENIGKVTVGRGRRKG